MTKNKRHAISIVFARTVFIDIGVEGFNCVHGNGLELNRLSLTLNIEPLSKVKYMSCKYIGNEFWEGNSSSGYTYDDLEFKWLSLALNWTPMKYNNCIAVILVGLQIECGFSDHLHWTYAISKTEKHISCERHPPCWLLTFSISHLDNCNPLY